MLTDNAKKRFLAARNLSANVGQGVKLSRRNRQHGNLPARVLNAKLFVRRPSFSLAPVAVFPLVPLFDLQLHYPRRSLDRSFLAKKFVVVVVVVARRLTIFRLNLVLATLSAKVKKNSAVAVVDHLSGCLDVARLTRF